MSIENLVINEDPVGTNVIDLQTFRLQNFICTKIMMVENLSQLQAIIYHNAPGNGDSGKS